MDLGALLSERGTEAFSLHERHLNAQLVKVLKTIGFEARFQRGQGAYLYDQNNERYLDCLSGFGVFAVGRNHPHVVRALQNVLAAELPDMVQMDVSLLSGLLAEGLLKKVPYLDRAFFCNSGTEAVEAAIKFARASTRRSRILYCSSAYHGLSYGALSLNGCDMFRQGFGPLLPDCEEVPWNNLQALEIALRSKQVAAFVFEPIQGKGVNMPQADYLQQAQRLCRQYGTLFVADEVQTGLGRTGKFLACEHWGLEPDMVLLAKALSGGFVPVGAVLTREAIFDKVYNRMDRAVVHGSTFSKNNMAMAAGLATLQVLEQERLVERSAQVGEQLISGLRAVAERSEFLREVRGLGTMIALEFASPRSLKLKAAWAMLEAANKGLFCQMVILPLYQRHRILTQVAGHNMPVIKLLPSFVMSDADVKWLVDSFASVLAECEKVPGSLWDLGRTLAGNALRARAGTA